MPVEGGEEYFTLPKKFEVSIEQKTGFSTRFTSVKDGKGAFKRPEQQFRNWISRDPQAEFPAEKDRYHICESDLKKRSFNMAMG